MRFLILLLAFAWCSWAQDSSALSATAPVVATMDTAAQRAKSDSINSNWLSKWAGKVVDVVVKPSSLKLGDYDAKASRQSVTIAVKEGVLEFSMDGAIPLKANQASKLSKAKNWKLHVIYHDKTVVLKKGVSRVYLIDGVNLEMDGARIPVFGEIWIADKVVASPSYKAWHDSLVAQGRLHTTVRGFALDRRDGQHIPWLSMGTTSWLSRYLSYESSSAYHCTESIEQSTCRRYSSDELSELCPAGWRLPSQADIQGLYKQWSPVGLPFGTGTQIWEVHDEDTTEASQGLMLLTPWSGLGSIEPHFWDYFETYATDSTGHVGLFQFAWSETGWMGFFEVNDADHIHHPVRCVSGGDGTPLPPIVPRQQVIFHDFIAPDLSKIPGAQDTVPVAHDATQVAPSADTSATPVPSGTPTIIDSSAHP